MSKHKDIILKLNKEMRQVINQSLKNASSSPSEITIKPFQKQAKKELFSLMRPISQRSFGKVIDQIGLNPSSEKRKLSRRYEQSNLNYKPFNIKQSNQKDINICTLSPFQESSQSQISTNNSDKKLRPFIIHTGIVQQEPIFRIKGLQSKSNRNKQNDISYIDLDKQVRLQYIKRRAQKCQSSQINLKQKKIKVFESSSQRCNTNSDSSNFDASNFFGHQIPIFNPKLPKLNKKRCKKQSLRKIAGKQNNSSQSNIQSNQNITRRKKIHVLVKKIKSQQRQNNENRMFIQEKIVIKPRSPPIKKELIQRKSFRCSSSQSSSGYFNPVETKRLKQKKEEDFEILPWQGKEIKSLNEEWMMLNGNLETSFC